MGVKTSTTSDHSQVLRRGRGEVNPPEYLSRHPTKHAATTSQKKKVVEECISYTTTSSTPKKLEDTRHQVHHSEWSNPAAIAEAIQKGTWHYVVKSPCVNITEFHPLEGVLDELTVTGSGKLTLHSTWNPQSYSKDHVVNLTHKDHQGLMKTKSLLCKKVWFSNIGKLVENKVKSCDTYLITTAECKREP